MSAHKPGTVAMVTDATCEIRTMILINDNGRLCWHGQDENGLRCLAADQADAVRPLVILDPENADETARLADLFCDARWSHIPGSDECDPLTRSSMRDALARFAAGERSAYPKPEEPTGLGAVVEDDRGVHWVRVEQHIAGNLIHFSAWRSRDVGAVPKEYSWPNINAVRVLSEGVVA